MAAAAGRSAVRRTPRFPAELARTGSNRSRRRTRETQRSDGARWSSAAPVAESLRERHPSTVGRDGRLQPTQDPGAVDVAGAADFERAIALAATFQSVIRID